MKKLTLIFIFLNIVLYGLQLEVSSLFDDDMVIQHSKTIQIWGSTKSNTNVDVQFINESFSTLADENGYWIVSLNSYDIGGPYEMVVESDDETRIFTNIMVGDVWLCSGQSNMNMPLAGWGRVDNYEQEIINADYPSIRLLTIPLKLANSPQRDVKTSGWSVCTPQTIKNFSAVAYFYAREVYKQTGIPIGLIHSSKGGTPIESWMCEEALTDRLDLKQKIDDVKNGSEEKYKELTNNYKREFKEWYKSIINIDLGNTENPKWYSTECDISEWNTMSIPAAWESHIGKYDGVVWFAKNITIPPAMIGQELELNLGPIQDYDITFFNGKKVGSQNSRNSLSVYQIPEKLVKPGTNRIVVRVVDLYGPGGMWGIHDRLELKAQSGNTLSLKGDWKYKQSIDLTQLKESPPERVNPDRNPIVLFNGMISPMVNLNIAGVIWYQGESNGKNAYQYRNMFQRMITHWRDHLSNPDLHFYFVQLANYMEPKVNPVNVEWPVLRESQAAALNLKNTGMASAIDLGDEFDVHPKNKQEVGRRLALNALNKYYKLDVAFSGPLYKSMKVSGDTIVISFTHTNGGLTKIDKDELLEFTIAGTDKVFYNASAKIINDKVMVFSKHATDPVAVRYAWQNNPNVNLYNSDGLPAYPFRTDIWKVKTQ